MNLSAVKNLELCLVFWNTWKWNIRRQKKSFQYPCDVRNVLMVICVSLVHSSIASNALVGLILLQTMHIWWWFSWGAGFFETVSLSATVWHCLVPLNKKKKKERKKENNTLVSELKTLCVCESYRPCGDGFFRKYKDTDGSNVVFKTVYFMNQILFVNNFFI